jgi:DNA-binding FadR family transcriptional regulator
MAERTVEFTDPLMGFLALALNHAYEGTLGALQHADLDGGLATIGSYYQMLQAAKENDGENLEDIVDRYNAYVQARLKEMNRGPSLD